MFAIYFVCLVSHTPLTPVNFATEHKQMLAHLYMLVNKDDNLNWFHRLAALKLAKECSEEIYTLTKQGPFVMGVRKIQIEFERIKRELGFEFERIKRELGFEFERIKRELGISNQYIVNNQAARPKEL